MPTSYRGDIAALFHQRGRCVQTVRTSSFGEQETFGREISSWGFSGKRHDPSGLVYFGRRYYLPSEGRWMTPDPAGFIDGPNLHHFCHNSPHSFIDWLGLKSEKPSGGIEDLDSGKGWGRVDQKPGGGFKGYIYFGPPKMYHPRPTHIRLLPPKLPLPTWAGCRIRLCASGHATVRYSLSVLHDVQGMCTVIGADDLEREERIGVMEWLESDQAARTLAVDLAVLRSFGVDGSDPVYQKYCRRTEMALHVGSWLVPAAGAGRTLLLPRLTRKLGRPTAVVRAGRLGSSVRACEVAGGMDQMVLEATTTTPKIGKAVDAIEDFLGGQGKIIKNADGDMILMRGDKKVRFDIKDPHGDKPHFHIEQQTPSGRWKDAGTEHRYYFQE